MTNSPDIKALRVKTETIKRYYVEYPGGDIYGGPFDTKEEAKECLKQAREIDAQHPIQ
jgi:hypothetical protein